MDPLAGGNDVVDPFAGGDGVADFLASSSDMEASHSPPSPVVWSAIASEPR